MAAPNHPGRRSKPGPISLDSLTIGFRLDAPHRQVLEERAASLGISPHALARHYVIEMLHQAEEHVALGEALLALFEQLRKIRGDVATTAEALLIAAGEVEADQARAWVAENFK
jgi:hypothetical protein